MTLPSLTHITESPEIMALECPDCRTVCQVRLTLLTKDGRIVHLTTCSECADGATIRRFESIEHRDYMNAGLAGLPIIGFKKRVA